MTNKAVIILYEQNLPAGTLAVASALRTWSAMNQFYLSGRTALALHLGHRQSKDLDFFTRDPRETLPALPKMDTMLQQFSSVQWELRTADQIQFRLNNVSVTLLAYPFPHHFPYHVWCGLAVADARDVAVQKAYTIGRRAQARDYLDIHAVLTHNVISFNDIIQIAQETYDEAFSARLFLQQLTYTKDLPDRDTALSLLTTPQSFETITEDLIRQVQTWATRRFQPPTRGPRL